MESESLLPIIVPVVLFAVLLLASLAVCFKSLAYRPAKDQTTTTSNLVDVGGVEAGGAATTPSPFDHARLMAFRASVLRVCATLWVLCSLVMVSLWGVPFSSLMYLVCLWISYWTWKANDAVARLVDLQHASRTLRARLSWCHTIAMLHMFFTAFQLLMWNVLWSFQICRDPVPSMLSSPTFCQYAQLGFGVLAIIVLFGMIVCITVLMDKLDWLILAHECLIAPPTNTLTDPAAAAASAPPYNVDPIVMAAIVAASKNKPFVVRRHMLATAPGSQGDYSNHLMIYFDKEAHLALQREQMILHLSGAEVLFRVPQWYRLTVPGRFPDPPAAD